MRRRTGAAATVFTVMVLLSGGTVSVGATTEPVGAAGGECPRDIAAAAAAATTVPAATEPAAVETTTAAAAGDDGGCGAGDHRRRNGGDRATADAAGERQRAQR